MMQIKDSKNKLLLFDKAVAIEIKIGSNSLHTLIENSK